MSKGILQNEIPSSNAPRSTGPLSKPVVARTVVSGPPQLLTKLNRLATVVRKRGNVVIKNINVRKSRTVENRKIYFFRNFLYSKFVNKKIKYRTILFFFFVRRF